LATCDFYTVSRVSFDPSRDYPLGLRRPDLVHTPAAIALDDVSLDRRDIGSTDDKLVRAAELAALPEETILEIYAGV
jgi:propanediol dehydratase small subunit